MAAPPSGRSLNRSPRRRRHQGRRLTALLAMAVAASLTLAGCHGSSEATSPSSVTSTPTPTETSVPATSDKPKEPRKPKKPWPLTGVRTAHRRKRPALSVKIENSLAARPQTGLDQADLVWEEVVEGGITRYIATYQSRLPSKIGPVRSIRPMDANIIASLGGALAYSGGKQPFIDRLAPAGIQSIVPTATGGGFFRTTTRSAPHNMYASPKDLMARIAGSHREPPRRQYRYARGIQRSTAVRRGEKTPTLAVHLTSVGHPVWTWNGKSGRFQRSEGATPAVTATGKRLAARNVIVLTVPLHTTSYRDPIGSPVPETIVVGSGDALVATGGKSVKAHWSKSSPSARVKLTVKGKKVRLAPGNTWIELMPTTGYWSVG